MAFYVVIERPIREESYQSRRCWRGLILYIRIALSGMVCTMMCVCMITEVLLLRIRFCGSSSQAMLHELVLFWNPNPASHLKVSHIRYKGNCFTFIVHPYSLPFSQNWKKLWIFWACFWGGHSLSKVPRTWEKVEQGYLMNKNFRTADFPSYTFRID